MSDFKKALLRVSTSSGAFDAEYAVQIRMFDGSDVSLFTDKSNVQLLDGEMYLNVYVLPDTPSSGSKHLLLPVEAFETASRWLDVRPCDVMELAA